MSIIESDVSDVALRRAMSDAARGDHTALGCLLDTVDNDKLLLVLGKVRAALDASSQTPAESLRVAGLLADRLAELPDPAHLMFSPRDLAIYILADVLTRTGAQVGDKQVDDLLSRIESKLLRLHVWSRVWAAMKTVRSSEPQQWFTTINRRMADEAVVDFINNLRGGDSAPTDDGVGSSLHFALTRMFHESGDGDRVDGAVVV